MKWLWGPLILLVANALATQCWVVDEEKFGTVEVIAEDWYGHRLQGAEIELRHIGNGKLHKTKLGSFSEVPYGEYQASVHMQGFQTSRRLLIVAQPTTHSRFLLELGSMTCGDQPPSLSGKVELPASNQPRVSSWSCKVTKSSPHVPFVTLMPPLTIALLNPAQR